MGHIHLPVSYYWGDLCQPVVSFWWSVCRFAGNTKKSLAWTKCGCDGCMCGSKGWWMWLENHNRKEKQQEKEHMRGREEILLFSFSAELACRLWQGGRLEGCFGVCLFVVVLNPHRGQIQAFGWLRLLAWCSFSSPTIPGYQLGFLLAHREPGEGLVDSGWW